MKISEKELALASESTGFRKETLEKVWRLMEILDGVSSHAYLKNRFALKGGTALNLFLLNLPRLSVDIDLNYIGSADRGIMAQERPEVEQALEAIFNRLNITAVSSNVMRKNGG
jgi:predicted nucleotidyltransferase component of viral defense system